MSNTGGPPIPRVVQQPTELRGLIARQHVAGHTIGLVPTMGALHEGHLSLVRRCEAECDFTVVTIFVNPTQFGPHEDFSRYPRTLDADLALLSPLGADLVFVPPTDTMYPPGCSTRVQPPAVSAPWEGACRPGHFEGVATIVLKLLNLVGSDIAYFGQKDYQQARVIEDLVQDLNVPVRIEICPIVREADGLAMSSRNRYLNDQQRASALSLSRALNQAVLLAEQGERAAERIVAQMCAQLQSDGVTDIDYVILADPRSLEEVTQVTPATVALIAARVGTTRLIDNCRLGDGPLL